MLCLFALCSLCIQSVPLRFILFPRFAYGMTYTRASLAIRRTRRFKSHIPPHRYIYPELSFLFAMANFCCSKAMLLCVVYLWERVTGWHSRHPQKGRSYPSSRERLISSYFYLCPWRLFVVKHPCTVYGRNDFIVIVRKDFVLHQNVACRL